MKGILGKKVGMTQVIQEDGLVVPVTVVEAGPCYVTQVRTLERDGYRAVQLGFEPTKPKHLSQGQQGHLKRAAVPPLRHLRELRIREDEQYELGQQVLVDIFQPGECVDVEARSKGRGFQGVVRRWGFAGGPRTHGQSDRERAPGAIGACAAPGKIWKGKKMPGRMGGKKVTVSNVEVVVVDRERNLLALRGSVPGPKGGVVLIKVARKQKVAKGGR
ncbi:MAG TPA: 50S ribosomal protein L3 [Anaerolineae bacterium]|nr:50S ribosomal protein L3 [Anaerolineae bacterium]HQH37577.1 50S ribosomal protein L3 [Anaerolineae bacterium]